MVYWNRRTILFIYCPIVVLGNQAEAFTCSSSIVTAVFFGVPFRFCTRTAAIQYGIFLSFWRGYHRGFGTKRGFGIFKKDPYYSFGH